ncbi:MAG: tellurium resistance protein TerC [Armatimonadota bacterium]|nr:tellurium resistance protein TerC [Armatimonadota bacterium]
MENALGVVLIILQLVYLEGILSIDNAAVLGAMVAHLPHADPIPWPRPLRFLEHPVHRLLGGQRLAALKVGLLGAYLGRGSMLFLAAWVVRNQWLLILGGLYLIFLAVSHFGGKAHASAAHAHAGPQVRPGLGFWGVVVNVELADLAFSLDNVVAAVALSREMWVVLTGVALGIITMRFAAGIFVKLIQREPNLEAAAYLLVLAIGLQLLAEELLHMHITHAMKFGISVSILVLAVVYGHVPLLSRIGSRLRWIQMPLAWVSGGVRALLRPAGWVVKGAFGALRLIVGATTGRRRGARVDPAIEPPAPSDGGR